MAEDGGRQSPEKGWLEDGRQQLPEKGWLESAVGTIQWMVECECGECGGTSEWMAEWSRGRHNHRV